MVVFDEKQYRQLLAQGYEVLVRETVKLPSGQRGTAVYNIIPFRTKLKAVAYVQDKTRALYDEQAKYVIFNITEPNAINMVSGRSMDRFYLFDPEGKGEMPEVPKPGLVTD